MFNIDTLKYFMNKYSNNNVCTEEFKVEDEKNSNEISSTKKSESQNRFLSGNINESQNKKIIFLVHKRKHSDDTNEQNILNKKTLYQKHGRNEKDNILTKIQIHYRNFLVDFINEVIKKIIVEECYKTKKLDMMIHLKEYLFNNIDHHFKSNIKKEYMKLAESMKIKDLLSPSAILCQKYKIKNKNLLIMEKIKTFNNPIINKLLNYEYLHFFNLYYNSEKSINIKEGELTLDFELNKKIKFFDDLIEKNLDDEKYVSGLKKFALLNFYKSKDL